MSGRTQRHVFAGPSTGSASLVPVAPSAFDTSAGLALCRAEEGTCGWFASMREASLVHAVLSRLNQ